MSRTSSIRRTMNAVRRTGLAATVVTGIAAYVAMAFDLHGLWTLAALFGGSVVVTVFASALSGHAGGPLPTRVGFEGVNPSTGLPYDADLGVDMSGQPWRGYTGTGAHSVGSCDAR